MDQPIRVLLVDDEPDFPETAATLLEREDDRLEVTPAASATAGLDRLETSQFDCVLSDYAMPEMDGLDFLGAVREKEPDLPFVLFTARGSEDVASEAITAGVSDYYQRNRHGEEEYSLLANRITNLVERHRAEREAEQTRSQLQAITESSADAIVTIDPDSTIKFANPAVRDRFGYDPEELLGEPLTVLMPERYREEHLEAVDRYLETGQRRLDWANVEFPGRRADGTEIQLSVSFGEFEQDGERRFVGIIRDVSEYKQIEADLREREERFRQLAENIREVVWMADPEKEELFYVNPAYEDVWGRSVESIYENPTSFLDAVHPEDRDRVEATSQDQTGGGYDEAYRIVRPDGTVRWVRDRAVPIRDDEGEIYRIVGVASDITEQKEETRRLETLISNLPGIVYRCHNEPTWPMEFVRGECDAITGYSPQQLVSGDVFWGEDVMHADDREEVWETVQRAVEADEPFEVTYRIVSSDGEVKWLWERGRSVATHGDERMLEGFISDITDRRERETQLVSLDRMLRHNLHNELNVVLGYADMVEGEADGELAEYGSTIAAATRRMLEQADKEREIVELLTEGSLPERLELRGALEARIGRLEATYPDAAISLEMPDPLHVTTIPEVPRAIEELVRNAIVHCDEEAPEVTIRANRRDGAAVVRVRDNGPGMPSQERRVIGDESPIDPLVHSSGMGLWLVKRIANRAGGTLRFEENDPEGNVVTLVVPGADGE